ncbi:translation initiation factor IF-2 [Brevundimonas staleyi]|uniref:Translation initiation factor IF-2 n=1 Tax=Brevundimonas staleyi TaxID=74326 RepID=A0ABW0FT67_9CAUL
MIRALLVAAALAAAPAAFAQTASAPAAPAAPQTPGEAEFEALAQAFGAKMEAMQDEMSAVITNTAGDPARRDSELDAIEARYQPEADAFATAVQTFAHGQAAQLPEAQQAEMRAQIEAAMPQIRGVPNQVRTGIETAAAQAEAAPAPAGS